MSAMQRCMEALEGCDQAERTRVLRALLALYGVDAPPPRVETVRPAGPASRGIPHGNPQLRGDRR